MQNTSVPCFARIMNSIVPQSKPYISKAARIVNEYICKKDETCGYTPGWIWSNSFLFLKVSVQNFSFSTQEGTFVQYLLFSLTLKLHAKLTKISSWSKIFINYVNRNTFPRWAKIYIFYTRGRWCAKSKSISHFQTQRTQRVHQHISVLNLNYLKHFKNSSYCNFSSTQKVVPRQKVMKNSAIFLFLIHFWSISGLDIMKNPSNWSNYPLQDSQHEFSWKCSAPIITEESSQILITVWNCIYGPSGNARTFHGMLLLQMHGTPV